MKSFKNLFKNTRDLFSTDYVPKTFGRLHVNRSEIVQPYLHYIDERRLTDNMDIHMNNGNQIDRMYMTTFKGAKKINRKQFIEDTQAFYTNDFPKEVSADIYNLYHKDPSKLDFDDRQDKNKFRYKILDTVIDPVARVISKDSHLKSMVMTRSMVQYFSMLMAYQKQTDPEEYENMKNALNGKNPQSNQGESQNGEGEGNDSEGQDDQNDQDSNPEQDSSKGSGKSSKSSKKQMTPEQVLEKLMKSDKLESLQEEILEDAKQTIEQMSQLSDDELDALYKSDMLDQGGSFDRDSISRLIQKFMNLKLDMKKVKPLIQKLLDNSRNYFNGKETTVLTPFLDAETIDSIEDIEFLHPKLRKLFIDDVMVKESKREGKIDIYIDISGSMGSTMIYNGGDISGLDFAKSFALQMINMDLVGKVYVFDTSISEIRNTSLSVSMIDYGGGTNINTVVKYIEQERNNSIVITDACDPCSIYSPFAYFIGIVGAQFNYFDKNVMETYADHAQAIEFDGDKVHTITKEGKRHK